MGCRRPFAQIEGMMFRCKGFAAPLLAETGITGYCAPIIAFVQHRLFFLPAVKL